MNEINTAIPRPVFKVPVSVNLSHEQKQIALRYLNEVHLGDPQCNVYSEELHKLVAKYPEKETEEFKDSHHKVQTTKILVLEFELQSDGTLKLLGISV